MAMRATGQDRRQAGGLGRFGAGALALLLAACGSGGVDTTRLGLSGITASLPGIAPAGPQAGEPGFVRGFLGAVAADEPRAALVARNTLSAGGTAADAAVAAAFTMAVTLPSRAGLGGGGACLVYNPRRNETDAILFPPGARAGVPSGADRPAAVPMLARGLFLLHTRGGRRPFEELLAPAEQAARFGIEVSSALANDLAAVSGPLFADPWAQASFAGPGGRAPGVGDRLVQADLGTTLSVLRTAGVGDLHQGGLARRLEETSTTAGGGLTVPELRTAVPQVAAAVQSRVGNDIVSFLPATADGGATPAAFGSGAAPSVGGPLPASAGLLVLDREGMAVACAFTMNNLFGTGRVAPGTGVLLAAAPGIGRVAPPLLAAGVAHSPSLRAFRAGAVGTGQEGAAAAAALPLSAMLRGADAAAALAAVPQPGRGLAIGCARYLPGVAESCMAAADPRGAGLALGADR